MELRGRITDALEDFEQEVAQGTLGGAAHNKLLALVQLPRVNAVDLASTSRTSGDDVLHAAVRAKATQLITACVRHGADPFVKDMNGRTADSVAPDASIHALLRQLTNAEVDESIAAKQSPTYRGFLGKWTNMVGGYKMRWFVLSDGVLSYYQSPDDEGRHARGSIFLRYAKIITDQRERNRFEIVSRMGKGMNKLYLRGSDSAESVRWIQMLEKAKRSAEEGDAKDPVERTRSPAGGLAAPRPVLAPIATQAPGLAPPPQQPPSAVSPLSSHRPSVAGSEVGTLDDNFDIRDDHSEVASLDGDQGIPHSKEFAVVNNMLNMHFDVSFQLLDQLAQSTAGTYVAPPVNTPEGLAKPVSQLSLGGQNTGRNEIIDALRASVQDRFRLWKEYNDMVQDRESYLKDQLEREVATRRLWEEQMTHLGKQHSELEGNLHDAVSMISSQRKELKRVQNDQMADTVKAGGENLSSGITAAVGGAAAAVGAVGTAATSFFNKPSRESSFDDVDDEFYDAVESGNLPNLYVEAPLSERQNSMNSVSQQQQQPTDAQEQQTDAPQTQEPEELTDKVAQDERRPSMREKVKAAAGAIGGAGAGAGAGAGIGEAIKRKIGKDKPEQPQDQQGQQGQQDAAQGQPQQGASQQGASQDAEQGQDTSNYPMDEPGFAPYEHLRETLPISKDNRPSMSLWAILKNNIGKDLTKISFPVAFNEPTSMLQRMAEDMEFSECLDAAALQSDSTRRIAYVAAFAASNYSSTIGRIAKPFNPMLGETFEYARPDLHYRYVSEQVSHHPPISACFAESPTWEYMGCVDAKSKFMGRTFEIRPTGVAHVQMKVNPDWVPQCKRSALKHAPNDENLLMEHYSWNKVTTSVGGFIVGSPTIDHHGDMTVVNHVTGDKCTLTFMPRGWRGADSREIRGKVTDASGKVVWDIAGRWNSQLVARRVDGGSSSLNPDSKVGNADPVSSSQQDSQLILLWRNSEKFASPFNLTPFAITLNSCPEDLRPWLPPTDCRLRPDLTAFENGKFDKADELKVYLENFQRETRRKRETGELPAHKPRWFERTTDPDTHAQFWKPLVTKGEHDRPEMSYWVERMKVGSEHAHGNTEAQWPECGRIFGEYSK